MSRRRACDVCSKRKIQCSIPESGPPCNWCGHQDIACTFARKPQRKSITLGVVQELYRRIEQLEANSNPAHDESPHVHQLSPSARGASTPINKHQSSSLVHLTTKSLPTGVELSPLTGISFEPKDLYCPGRHSGLNWYFRGTKIFSAKGKQWLSSRTGQTISLSIFLPLDLRAASIPSLARLEIGPQPLEPLPEVHTSCESMEVLLRSDLHRSFPLLDRSLCIETIRKAHGDPADVASSSRIAAQASVWCLKGISCCVRGRNDPRLHLESEASASRAQALIEHINEESSREALEAVLLLTLYRMFTGQWRSASALCALACRIVCDIGGQFHASSTEAEGPSTKHLRQHIRRLFWICNVLDKDMSMRLERSPILSRDYCDLTLPLRLELSGRPNDNAYGYTNLLSHSSSLSLVKETALRLLYSPTALDASESQLLLNIRQLDADLEEWRLSVPSLIRPKLAISRNKDETILFKDISVPQRVEYLALQLDYHYTLINIHTPVRRCGTANDDGHLPEDLHNVVHSSIDLSLEAGRSTLLLVRTVVDILHEGAFRYICFYVPIAAMALFVNILVHPHGEKACSDAELLAVAAGSIQSILLRSLSTNEKNDVKKLGNFVRELSRLGDCAIEAIKIPCSQ